MSNRSRVKPKRMANESTPLIATVTIAPARQRYPHHTCRRFFTLATSCLLIAGFVVFAFHCWPDLLPPHHHRHKHHGPYSVSVQGGSKRFGFDDLKVILLDTPTSDHAREWSQYYTAGPHLAGANLSQAEWTRDKWEQWGVPSTIATYDIYTNYHVDHSLTLLKQSGDSKTWDLAFKASLTEDVLDEDPTTSLKDRVPTFHGYSASGNVTGQFVWANYGTFQDYAELVEAGIELEGKISIVKYGGIFRGLKVKRAQELGMIGVLIYSDPGDDDGITEENGYKPYPKGPARNPSSVQRGSVEFLSARPGDPTTPGYASKPGVPRAPGDDCLAKIPSIPISYADALPLLKTLNGHGPKASDLGKYWDRNLGLKYKGVDYNVGPSPEGVVLNLYNEQDYKITPQWDVIGIINGTIPNEVIVVGNHRDAWVAGGAADPNSGSAVLNEAIRSFGKALEQGWKPLRTIVFGSWDGEEYGLLGSTEWVEEYLPWISDANLAYINVDVGVKGTRFSAAAAPLLNQLIRDVTHLVPSPNQTVEGQTVGDLWDGAISNMGSGSDYTAFQDYAGVPSLDMGFKEDRKAPVYHYHSNYDSFHWMEEYGDPGFVYHKTMAQVLGLMVGKLSESLVVSFGATEYADKLSDYLGEVEAKLKPAKEDLTEEEINMMRAQVTPGEVVGSEDLFKHKLEELHSSIAELRIKSGEVDELAAWASRELDEDLAWWEVIRKFKLGRAIVNVNKKYKQLERNFLYEGGLDGRNWFKHVVFAPGLWTGYAGALYPGLVESIDARDYSNAVRWAGIIDTSIRKAIKSLE